MKRYPKIVQCDSRGQVVIPKDIRNDLSIDEGTGFWMYSITNEGILLKKIDVPQLDDNKDIVNEVSSKAEKIGVKKSNISESVKKYKKTKQGKFDII